MDEEIHNTGAWKKYENRMHGVNLRLAFPHEVDGLMFNLFYGLERTKQNNKRYR